MANVDQIFKTPLTELLGIKHPVMLAGMNVAAGPELAAAGTFIATFIFIFLFI